MHRVLALVVLLIACKPKNVSEAEAKGDVTWLDQDGTSDSMAALGRIADKNDSAVSVLKKRAAAHPPDLNVFLASWLGVERDQKWASTLFHDAFKDPAAADIAAQAMGRGSAKLSQFLPDFEMVLRDHPGDKFNTVASVLASAPGSGVVVDRLLANAATRDETCRGIASKDSSKEARSSFMKATSASRDGASCVDAAVILAVADDEVLKWLEATGEPGLLSAISLRDTIACPRVRSMWDGAIHQRTKDAYPALAIPLGGAVKRCGVVFDGFLRDALAGDAASQTLAIGAIDPFDSSTTQLRQACGILPSIQRTALPARIRERAADAVSHRCKG